jgi:hypothetical protein
MKDGAHLKETKDTEAFLDWEGALEKKGRTFWGLLMISGSQSSSGKNDQCYSSQHPTLPSALESPSLSATAYSICNRTMVYTVYTEIERNIFSADLVMQLDSDPPYLSVFKGKSTFYLSLTQPTDWLAKSHVL